MSKQEAMKLQTCVLRVNIHCDGCKKKVKKLLQKIEGVYTVAIDAEQGKVTVTGAVDPNILVSKLEKSGKHAELWGPSKNSSNQNNLGLGYGNQFKNIQFENGKFGKPDNKPQSIGGNNKGGHPQQQQQQLVQQQQLMKGFKDMKMVPNKEQKTVRFSLPEEDEFDGSGDDFDDEFGDDDDSLVDEFGDEFGHSHHQKVSKPSAVGGGQHGNKGNKGNTNEKKGSSGGAKKRSIFDNIPFLMKGLGKKSEAKHGKGGKTNGGGGGDGKSKGGGDKDGGKNGGMRGNFGKNSEFGNFGKISEFAEVLAKSKGGNGAGNGAGNGGGGDHGNHGAKKGGGKNNDGFQANNKAQVNFNGADHHHAANHPKGGATGGRGGEDSYAMGQMGTYPMGPIGGYPMGQMGGMPEVQGQPAMNGGGYYQNPYQQQHLGMMMNQQQQQQQHGHYGNQMYQPMMYARPPQPVGYVPPMPPPASDPYLNMFSDENTGSCSVM